MVFNILSISSLSNHPNFAAMAEGSDLNLTNYLEEVEKASPGILNAYIKQVWTFPTQNLEDINRFHVDMTFSAAKWLDLDEFMIFVRHEILTIQLPWVQN